MIVLIGGEKGGTGKSTIAVNLAAWLARAGRDVLLVDTDRQGTAAAWASERQAHPSLARVHCAQRYGALYDDVVDYAKRYDELVIDAGGRDSEELRSAMCAAEVLISPFPPAQADLWTVGHLAELVKLARGFNPGLIARMLINVAPTNWRVKKAAEARELLEQFEQLELVPAPIHRRQVFDDAMCDGRGVVEMDNKKAREELEALARGIYGEQIQSQGHAA